MVIRVVGARGDVAIAYAKSVILRKELVGQDVLVQRTWAAEFWAGDPQEPIAQGQDLWELPIARAWYPILTLKKLDLQCPGVRDLHLQKYSRPQLTGNIGWDPQGPQHMAQQFLRQGRQLTLR